MDVQALIRENHQLKTELERRSNQLIAVIAVAKDVSQTLDLNLTLEKALETVVQTTGAVATGISLIDDQTNEIVLRAQKGWFQDFVHQKPMRIPLGKGLSGRVVSNNEVIVNNDLDEHEQLAVPSFHDEKFRSMALAPMHAGGKIIGIISMMSYVKNSFDEASIEILVTVADTVGVAIENARLYEQTLRSEREMSAILHATADGILATDPNGNVRLINNTAAAMLHLSHTNVVGLPLRELPIQQNIRESLLFALSSRSETENTTFRVKTQNGRILSALVSPIRFESQLVMHNELQDGWVIVLQDMTRLLEAAQARTQFIQEAAHDMRNPLSAAINALELLHPHTVNNDEALELVNIAGSSIDRIRGLIDDLLQLERIEQEGRNLQITDINLDDFLQTLSSAIYPLIQSKHIHFQVELQSEVPDHLFADKHLLLRALLNYLDNAIKYTPVEGRIKLKLYINEQMLHFEVVDSGAGIPQAAQARLFERFYRTDPNSPIRGTGLGLAIVKSVAEAHGGTVYVTSAKNRGSTFGMSVRLASVENALNGAIPS